ncbi:MAG TPA: UDP-N-acetylmuramate dehydrogenase [Solirubrobacteraceae bacterium]
MSHPSGAGGGALGAPPQHGVMLAELTTLHLGGPARRLVEATRDDQIVDAVAAADATGEPVLVVAGGSNLVIADTGFAGTVVHVRTRGVASETEGNRVRLAVAAGEPWDGLVAHGVADGLAGIECLAGIPGSAGATPIQNVGAYGQQVSDTISSVRAYDRSRREVIQLAGSECGFAYRSSMFRRSSRYVVLEVTFELERSPLGRPLRYPELARALGVEPGARVPVRLVREAVLALRRQKGMVIDANDPDSVSAGSFFINPILPADGFVALERRATERLGATVRPPAWPEPDGRVKTSAAWLIERAGFHRGLRRGRVGISSKHTLALVNRGGASTSELLALAREIQDGVREAFGVTLRPEPTLVEVEL